MEGKRTCYKKLYGEKTAKDSINKLQNVFISDGIGNEEVWNSQNGREENFIGVKRSICTC